MNSRPEIIRSDYKQTNFDILQDDTNDEEEDGDEPVDQRQQQQQQQLSHRIKITDKPIPLDNLTKDDAHVVELDNQARYLKLKQARDRLIHQKHEVKPTPLFISPVKKKKNRNINNNIVNETVTDVEQDITSDSMFEPVSTKIFPSSKQREERIRLLKKMIHDAEKKSKLRERQEHHDDENAIIDEVKPNLESLKEVTLSPPPPSSSPVFQKNHHSNSDNTQVPTLPPSLQNSVTPDDVSNMGNDEIIKLSNKKDDGDSSLELDDAIDNFQDSKLNELNKETSFQIDDAKFPQHELLFEDVDKRLAILEFQIEKIQTELWNLQHKTRETGHTNFGQPVLVKRLKLGKVLLLLSVICCFLVISFILAD